MDRIFQLNDKTKYYVNRFRTGKSFSENESNSDVHLLHVALCVTF